MFSFPASCGMLVDFAVDVLAAIISLTLGF